MTEDGKSSDGEDFSKNGASSVKFGKREVRFGFEFDGRRSTERSLPDSRGPKIRVGFDPKGKGFFGKKNVYTHLVKNCPGLRHTVERNLDVVRRIGIFPLPQERDLFFHVPQEALSSVQQKVGPGPFFLIHPTSRWRFKCWPVEQMKELSHQLIQRGHRLVFTSGPDPFRKPPW